MKLGILGDIHGNYHALRMVIEDMQCQDVNTYIILGDLVIWGDEPQRCYEAIRDLNPLLCIRGNTDDWFNEIDESFVPHTEREIKLYHEYKRVEALLTLEAIQYIKNLPFRDEIMIHDKRIVCVHGSDQMIDEPIGIMRSSDEIEDIFRREAFDILLCGHTHRPYIVTNQDKIIMNIGSVGLSMDKSIAEYGLLILEEDRFEFGIRRIRI